MDDEQIVNTETQGDPEVIETEDQTQGDLEETVETTVEETDEQAQETVEEQPFFEYGDEKFTKPENLQKYLLAHDRRLWEKNEELRKVKEENERLKGAPAKETPKPEASTAEPGETDWEAEYAKLPDPNEDWDAYNKAKLNLDLGMARELKALRAAKKQPDITQAVKEVIGKVKAEDAQLSAEQQRAQDFDALPDLDPEAYGVTDDVRFVIATPSHPDHQKAMNLKKVAEYVSKGLSVQEADFLVARKVREAKPEKTATTTVSPAAQTQDQLRRSRSTIISRPPQVDGTKTKPLTSLDDALRAMKQSVAGQ